MQIIIAKKNVVVTPFMQKKIERKVKKIEKYLPKMTEAQINLRHNEYQYTVSMTLHVAGSIFTATETTERMSSSVDRAIDKIMRQAKRYKERLKEHKVRQNRTAPPP